MEARSTSAIITGRALAALSYANTLRGKNPELADAVATRSFDTLERGLPEDDPAVQFVKLTKQALEEPDLASARGSIATSALMIASMGLVGPLSSALVRVARGSDSVAYQKLALKQVQALEGESEAGHLATVAVASMDWIAAEGQGGTAREQLADAALLTLRDAPYDWFVSPKFV